MMHKPVLAAKLSTRSGRTKESSQPPTEIHRFVYGGTWGVDWHVQCWCGKKHYASQLGWRVMTDRLNAFMAEHERCEPPEVQA